MGPDESPRFEVICCHLPYKKADEAKKYRAWVGEKARECKRAGLTVILCGDLNWKIFKLSGADTSFKEWCQGLDLKSNFDLHKEGIMTDNIATTAEFIDCPQQIKEIRSDGTHHAISACIRISTPRRV